MHPITRRSALRSLALLGGAAAYGRAGAQPPAPPRRPPALDRAMVEEFVRAGHARPDRVRELLAAEPGLVNATWDWGGGDFETALGGASHMGRADIAETLLAAGARLDLFCAAMLGRVEFVRAALAEFPGVVRVRGPHGISLLRHAQAGKQEAMVELLKRHGAE